MKLNEKRIKTKEKRSRSKENAELAAKQLFYGRKILSFGVLIFRMGARDCRESATSAAFLLYTLQMREAQRHWLVSSEVLSYPEHPSHRQSLHSVSLQ